MQTPTTAVHCKRSPYDVYIGRPSKWGNPFIVGRDGQRGECIEKYRAWVMTQPDLLAALPELKGRALGCWCSPQPCHGDVLAALADETLASRRPPQPQPTPPYSLIQYNCDQPCEAG